MNQSMIEQYRAARVAGVPLIAITTPDAAATLAQLFRLCNGTTPLYQWDISGGFRHCNTVGAEALLECNLSEPEKAAMNDPAALLKTAQKLPANSVLVLHNAQRIFRDDPQCARFNQALWNLRDPNKEDGRSVVLLAPQFNLPPELAGDIVMLDEPLPNDGDLQEIVDNISDAANIDVPPTTTARAVAALRGLSAFTAEQVTAMSLTQAGLDLDALWERKRHMIEQSPGLNIYRGKEGFADLGGLEEAKAFLTDIVTGAEPPAAVGFIDEVDRLIAGGTSGSDSSGVSQDMLGTFLTQTTEMGAIGALLVGLGGTGKSAMAKAVGNEAGVPTVIFDPGAMKGGIVGQSEQNIRRAFKTLRAMSGDRVLLLATTNNIGLLPPEVRRRFSLGVIYFDLPDAVERSTIWPVWLKKYGITPQQDDRGAFSDEHWTGDDIRRCCELAYRTRRTLSEASKRVVPLARSNPDAIERLRCEAEGRFLSASYPGVYTRERSIEKPRAKRRLALAGE